MNNDFVYDQIYKGALRAGAIEKAAKDHAVMGLQKYKRGQFKKAVDLIQSQIAAAKKVKK